MRLLWIEMKKIWRPGILAVIVLLGIMFYWVRPEYYQKYYGEHRPIYQLSAEWAEKYGPTMEQSEREELDGQLEEEIETFTQLISSIPEAVEAGITDYESFVAFSAAHHNALRSDADPAYYGSETFTQREFLIRRIWGGTNYERIQELDYFMFAYDFEIDTPFSSTERFLTDFTPQEQARILDLEAMDQRGYLPEVLKSSTSSYFRYLAIWNIMGVILMLSPVLIRDRLRRVCSMQWSSRQGRQMLRTQMAAGMISALLFSIIGAIIYSCLFLANGVLIFKDFPLYNKFFGNFTWFDLTYGQYILALLVMGLLAGLITGALTLFLSQYSSNYVVMLLKAVPLFLGLWIIIAWTMSEALFLRENDLTENWFVHWPKGIEIIVIALLLMISSGLCTWACIRQKKRDLV